MDDSAKATKNLTRNQNLVLKTLLNSHTPLSAYAILDQLKHEGFKAPLQVYRALDHLMMIEKVHRLESLNAFVACCNPGDGTHDTTAFTICDDCGQVSELSSKKLNNQIFSVADDSGFIPKKSTIELHGLCRRCQTE